MAAVMPILPSYRTFGLEVRCGQSGVVPTVLWMLVSGLTVVVYTLSPCRWEHACCCSVLMSLLLAGVPARGCCGRSLLSAGTAIVDSCFIDAFVTLSCLRPNQVEATLSCTSCNATRKIIEPFVNLSVDVTLKEAGDDPEVEEIPLSLSTPLRDLISLYFRDHVSWRTTTKRCQHVCVLVRV